MNDHDSNKESIYDIESNDRVLNLIDKFSGVESINSKKSNDSRENRINNKKNNDSSEDSINRYRK